ncbi:MAG: hypothetical protein IJ583_18010 [Firmicutes bacterium]|nr:hypothetical protein [Bacillota bacterium]
MKKEVEKYRPDTVNMLLNPKMFNGRNEGRTAPLFLTLLLIFSPLILLLNTLLSLMASFGVKPVLWVFVPLYLFYCWKVIARVMLREKERTERFKREQLEKYTKIDDITGVRRIHPDGCVEYANGDISYFLYCKNGNKADPIVRASELEKFFTTISDFPVDIHIFNLSDSSTLSERYKNISAFSDSRIARDMLEIIDYNKKYVEDNSLVTVTIFELKGQRHERAALKARIESGCKMLDKKTYREVIAADKELASFVLNRTLTSDVDFEDIFMGRFSKGEYYSNKILGYDMEYKPKKKEIESESEGEFEWIEKL